MESPGKKRVVIIGAGPAGLTAAYQLAASGQVEPIVLEASERIGGISTTVNHNGNRIDIGGHRFFSKSERVMRWWSEMLPVFAPDNSGQIHYHGSAVEIGKNLRSTPSPDKDVLLVRHRKSRIFFENKLFAYPLRLSLETIRKLGIARLFRAGSGYLAARLLPRNPEKSLEDFLVNRFGRPLYRMFFESYTLKVWGRPCREISAAWGAQRIKGLSISKALAHAFRSLRDRDGSLAQKNTETSLIERFLYPRHGPGHLWEKCAEKIRSLGGTILTDHRVTRLTIDEHGSVTSVVSTSSRDGETIWDADAVISSMPVKDLVAACGDAAPPEVARIASALPYRDFLTVGLLFRKLRLTDSKRPPSAGTDITDNWIYIQDPRVHVGRIQIFNNWSPDMVASPEDTVWLGLEFFCQEGDETWRSSQDDLIQLSLRELDLLGIASPEDYLDGTIVRMPKAYPAYFGSYEEFDVVQKWSDSLGNLFLVGRNGMHRYNNQDHSMLTAMIAAEQILKGERTPSHIWQVNTENDYHESSSDTSSSP